MISDGCIHDRMTLINYGGLKATQFHRFCSVTPRQMLDLFCKESFSIYFVVCVTTINCWSFNTVPKHKFHCVGHALGALILITQVFLDKHEDQQKIFGLLRFEIKTKLHIF